MTFAGVLRKMSLEGEGMPQLVGARRGDSSLLPQSINTQQERGGGLREGAGAERQRSEARLSFFNKKFFS